MKTTKTRLLLIMSIFALMIGCSDDESIKVDSTPEFQSLLDEISSLPGETFTFTGIVSDPAGIESINMKYEAWFLDKTITKQDSVYDTYELSYKFKVPADAIVNSQHTIPVTITNRGGKSATRNVVVTLDRDIAAPNIQITSPINGGTVLIGSGTEIDLNISVTDNKALTEFTIESSVLNETISISGSTYNYTNALDITDPGSYEFTFTATDASGNVGTATVSLNVLNELLFDVMYLTDETTNAGLNNDLFGIPFSTVASVAASEDGYVFTGRYYSTAANSEVRFTPQQASFEPYSFGADASTAGKLVLGTDASVSPIIIPGVGYYEIKMDLRDQSYTVTPYTPTDTAFGQIYILGRGIYTNNSSTSTCVNNNDGSNQCWHFNSGKPFSQDATNQYLWTIDVTVKDEPNDAGANGFILNSNPATWAPFWRVDVNGGDPSRAIPGGGNNYVFDASALDKDYTFVFDTHLNRIVVKNR